MIGRHEQSYRLGVDIGGTFTDIVLAGPNGEAWTMKVASTAADYSLGIAGGIRRLLEERGVPPAVVGEVVHATTVATNAIIQSRGAKTGLITTLGFRDVLELRRLRVPELYNLSYAPPRPLVERRLRTEAAERINATGTVITPLDEATVHAAIDRLLDEGAEAVAVCLLHSYLNPAHERRIGEIVERRMPGCYLSLSVDILPEVREYERTSTTVINSYIGPIISTYLDALDKRLRADGIRAPLRVMQSNGGVMTAARARIAPAHIVESGPAAGVVAAQWLAGRIHMRNLMTFDMGGTTAKASVIEDGRPGRTTEYEVGAGITLSSRLVKGSGHALKLPVLDLAEVGAGGGSLVHVDPGGALKVGPESAGAEPGPACYGAGGDEPTVTDANLILGYIGASTLAGGEVRLHPDLARSALEARVAGPLGMSMLAAAFGVHAVANATMIRAIKAVTTYRGRDPREFALLAFGGSGPVHAAHMARELGVSTVLIPAAPGLFSAVGLLEARPEYHFVQTLFAASTRLEAVTLMRSFADLRERALRELAADEISATDVLWDRALDMRYAGQGFELTIPAPGGPEEPIDVGAQLRRFHAEHERTYGYQSPGDPVEIVNLRLVAVVRQERSRGVRPVREFAPVRSERQVCFAAGGETMLTPVIGRADLSGEPSPGPLIIEEYDATSVVPPGCAAQRDRAGNIVIDVGPEPQA